MQVTQRQMALVMLTVLTVGALSITAVFLFMGAAELLPMALPGSVAFIALLVVYWRGWQPARYLTVALITLLIAFTIATPGLIDTVGTTPLLAVTLAALITTPAWAIGVALIILIALALRISTVEAGLLVTDLIVYAMNACGIVLIRVVAETAQRQAETQAARAEAALARSEAQSAELGRRTEELSVQNEQQARLLDLVATLETSVVELAEGVLLAPIVGQIDSRRADQLTARLLHAVSTSRARLVILDIAGVSTVDTGVAQALLRAVQSVRLLGCAVMVTGISAAVATTMTQLGISMAGVSTARTPQEALAQYSVASSG